MAITTQASTPARRGAITNSTTADLSGTETLRAAPGAGISIYLRHFVINTDTQLSITIGAGKTSTAVTTVIAGPFYLAADGNIEVTLPEAIKLAANTALTADASGSGNVTILSTVYERP